MNNKSRVYMVPTFLDELAIHTIPAYVLDCIKTCEVFFVENERSARRFIKALDKGIIIDKYEWFTIHKTEELVRGEFRKKVQEGKIIGILSEAGCPGVADPGQFLAGLAQEIGLQVVPLVGPSSILLALMASGMNGQHFRFVGYLPIESQTRQQCIRELEADSSKTNCTQIFIETPYRNNQLIEVLLKTCRANTRLCVAANITGKEESIRTKTIAQWRADIPQLHKIPVIFLIQAG
ncbi:MAG: SAM-dependent methyltransferase [Chitinophagales bacterium]